MSELNHPSLKQSELFYLPLVCLFQSIVLITNVIGAKVIQIGFLLQPVGCFIFPLSYGICGILTEIYGLKRARYAIWLALCANILLIILIQIAIWLPPAPNWLAQSEYAAVLGGSLQITVASLLSFAVGEVLNSGVIAHLKTKWQAKKFGLRALLATAFAEACGTSIMIGCGFWGQIPSSQLFMLGISYYSFKMLVFAGTVPLLTQLATLLKQK